MTFKLPCQAVMFLSIATLRFHSACSLPAGPTYAVARPLADDRGGRSDYGVHAAQTFHKDSVVADGGRTSTESFRDAEALYGLMHNALDRSPEEQKNDEPTKRHSDGLFTDLYSRYRKKMAVRKYLSTVLGKRKYFKHRARPYSYRKSWWSW